MESPQYSEKFVHLPPSGSGHSGVGYKTQLAVVLVSQTALATLITVNPVETTTNSPNNQTSSFSVTKSVSSVLGIRCRVKHATMTYLKGAPFVYFVSRQKKPQY